MIRCSRCHKTTRAKVLESRPHDGRVWRRRQCGLCFATFVTREEAPEGLRMPAETSSKHRAAATDRTPKPEERGLPKVGGDAGLELVRVWK